MTRRSIDVLGLGVVAVDEVLYVDEYPAADRKAPVREWIRRCGGLTAIALQAAAQMGSRVAYAGCLGTDRLSRDAIRLLRQAGVGTVHLVIRPEAGPYHSVVLVDRARSTRNIFFDSRAPGGAYPTSPSDEVIRSARVLLVDGHGLEGMVRAASIARDDGVAVIGDLENPEARGEAEALLPLVDHLVLSLAVGQRLTGETDPNVVAHALWREGRHAVVLTDGANGTWFISSERQDHLSHQPAFPVDAVDTTGCGDVFHGVYAHGIAHGWGIEDAIRAASAAGAAMAARSGTAHVPPNREIVERMLSAQNLDGRRAVKVDVQRG
ncbi:MAG: hypothetical protein IVW53_08370 [Chloroflexi bacterium]|nr:hypothetical protein [Chloroflexota bacterium]